MLLAENTWITDIVILAIVVKLIVWEATEIW
jgi:hypothetical protein